MPLGELADAGLRLVRFGARRRIGLPAVDEPFTLGGCARLEWTWDRLNGQCSELDRGVGHRGARSSQPRPRVLDGHCGRGVIDALMEAGVTGVCALAAVAIGGALFRTTSRHSAIARVSGEGASVVPSIWRGTEEGLRAGQRPINCPERKLAQGYLTAGHGHGPNLEAVADHRGWHPARSDVRVRFELDVVGRHRVAVVNQDGRTFPIFLATTTYSA